MKRIVILAIAAVAMFSMVATAGAAELKVSGKFHTNFGVFNNYGSWQDEGNGRQSTQFETRFRPAFDFVASEALSARLELEIGDVDWGKTGETKSGAFRYQGDNTSSIELRRAYMNFIIPNTKANVRIGLQGISLPNSFGGHPVWDSENAAGAVVSTPVTDMVSLTAGFVRALKGDDSSADQQDASADMWFAAVPVKAEGFSLTPYMAYVSVTKNGFNLANNDAGRFGGLLGLNGTETDDDAPIWYAGAAFEMTMFDPFVVKANFVYGSLDAEEDNNDRSGWSANAAFDYKGFDFVTPELVVAYTSGEDDAKNSSDYGESNRLPAFDQYMNLGSYWLGNGDFVDTLEDESNLGYWLVGLNLKDISLVDKLTQTIGVYYIKGTNSKDVIAYSDTAPITFGKTLTEDDSVWEVSLTSHYKIYDELTAYLDLVYISPDFDDEWNVDDEAGTAAVFGLVYQF